MNQATSFVISKFTNPSGDVVFRVTGNLDGQRVRKNFSTRGKDTTPAGSSLPAPPRRKPTTKKNAFHEPFASIGLGLGQTTESVFTFI